MPGGDTTRLRGNAGWQASGMTFTPETILAIGTAMASVIVAIGTFVMTLRNGRKTEQVHKLVNSEMQKTKDEVARLTNIIANLTGTPADRRSSDEAAGRAKTNNG